jgi:acetylornithine aminotransferase
MSHLMNTYGRQAVAFEKGEGAWLWDTNGKRYLDALAGIAVNGLGHAHPRLVKAIADQAGKVIHTSNIYQVPLQEALAARLAAISGMDKTFFCNSGAEANEAAIKLARLYGTKKGIEEPAIIVMEKAWHGRTIATLAATGSAKASAGFGKPISGFLRVPYNNLDAIQTVADQHPEVVAVLFEPIQGEGGIRLADIEYQRALHTFCRERGLLYMVDEVQCGIGRTGAWFGFQHTGVLPDVMSLAKGLGSGVPIGACVAAGVAAEVFQPGTHGTTFGGGPLVCAAALETLAVMQDEHLLSRAESLGYRMITGLEAALSAQPGVKEIRGHGLMIGVELDRPCAALVALALEKGLLINVTQDSVVRLLPPLILKDEEADQIISILVPLIQAFLKT